MLPTLFLFPLYVESTYVLHMMILIFVNVIAGSSWNILGGYTGQYSVGHAAYFGVGAYTTMILMQFKHLAPWWGVWAGLLLSHGVQRSPADSSRTADSGRSRG